MTTTAIAIVSLILSKAFDKTAKGVLPIIYEQSSELLEQIKIKSPTTADELESANLQTSNLVNIVHEVELIAENDEEFAQKLNKVSNAMRKELLAIELKEREEPSLPNSKSTFPLEKFADKVGVYINNGGTLNIENFNF
ncbi:hypothetical protein ACEYW6_28295 [Nostoc sp. UIC 10607]|uniref:hypothetical protein n=1 Tax=Nostoc sp. UIC 10607 TaxID=3045935 RepID=UPI0039A100F9